jgi:hypothetical protein
VVSVQQAVNDAMKDILIKRIFWVILGVVLLALLVFYVLKVRGLAAQNAASREALLEKVTKMEKFAKTSDLKNEKWLRYAEDRRRRVDDATAQCEEYLAQNVKKINTRFLTDPEDPGSREILDRAHWKERYVNQEIPALLANLQKAGVRATKDSFDFRDREWGGDVPTFEQINGERTAEGVLQPGAQKEFWLQSYLADCIINVRPASSEEKAEKGDKKGKGDQGNSRVFRVVKVQIQRPSTSETAAIEGATEAQAQKAAQFELVDNTYLVIPFVLTVDMDWRFVPLLIRNMETSPWPFYVVTLNAARPGEVDKSSASAGRGSQVRITIHSAALDFTPLKYRAGGPAAPAKPN